MNFYTQHVESCPFFSTLSQLFLSFTLTQSPWQWMKEGWHASIAPLMGSLRLASHGSETEPHSAPMMTGYKPTHTHYTVPYTVKSVDTHVQFCIMLFCGSLSVGILSCPMAFCRLLVCVMKTVVCIVVLPKTLLTHVTVRRLCSLSLVGSTVKWSSHFMSYTCPLKALFQSLCLNVSLCLPLFTQ